MESGLLEEGQAGAGIGPQGDRKHPTTSILDPSSDPLLSAASASSRPDGPPGPRTYYTDADEGTDARTHHTHLSIGPCHGFWLSCLHVFSSTEPSEEPLVDLSEVLNTDADLLRMLGKQTGDSGMSLISEAVIVGGVYCQPGMSCCLCFQNVTFSCYILFIIILFDVVSGVFCAFLSSLVSLLCLRSVLFTHLVS